MPPEAIDEAVQRYGAGKFSIDLNREYGIFRSGLAKLLRDGGVKLRKQLITAKDEQRAVKLYESGMTIKPVAGQVGYSYGTIRRCFMRIMLQYDPAPFGSVQRSVGDCDEKWK